MPNKIEKAVIAIFKGAPVIGGILMLSGVIVIIIGVTGLGGRLDILFRIFLVMSGLLDLACVLIGWKYIPKIAPETKDSGTKKYSSAFHELFGIETVKDIGVVDTTEFGSSRYTTKLAVRRKDDKLFLEVYLSNKVFLSWYNQTFYWSIEGNHLPALKHDLQRTISAFGTGTGSPLKGHLLVRFIMRIQGFHAIADLGGLSFTDGISKSSGFLVENSDNKFLVIKTSMYRQTDYYIISQNAVQAILTKINELR